MQRSATCVASPSLARAGSAAGSNAPGAYIVHKVDVTTGTEVDLFVNTFKELDVNAVGSVAVGIVPVVPPVPPQVASAKPNGVGIADDYNDVFYAFGHDVYSLYVAALAWLVGGWQPTLCVPSQVSSMELAMRAAHLRAFASVSCCALLFIAVSGRVGAPAHHRDWACLV